MVSPSIDIAVDISPDRHDALFDIRVAPRVAPNGRHFASSTGRPAPSGGVSSSSQGVALPSDPVPSRGVHLSSASNRQPIHTQQPEEDRRTRL